MVKQPSAEGDMPTNLIKARRGSKRWVNLEMSKDFKTQPNKTDI